MTVRLSFSIAAAWLSLVGPLQAHAQSPLRGATVYLQSTHSYCVLVLGKCLEQKTVDSQIMLYFATNGDALWYADTDKGVLIRQGEAVGEQANMMIGKGPRHLRVTVSSWYPTFSAKTEVFNEPERKAGITTIWSVLFRGTEYCQLLTYEPVIIPGSTAKITNAALGQCVMRQGRQPYPKSGEWPWHKAR